MEQNLGGVVILKRRISPSRDTFDLGTDPSPPAQDDTLRHRALIFCLSVIPAISGRNLSPSVIPDIGHPAFVARRAEA